MDFNDFFGPTGTEGTRGMRIATGLLGAVAGGAAGWGSAVLLEASSVAWGVIGTLLGGFFGAAFSFAIIVGLLMGLGVVLFVVASLYLGGS